MTVKVYWGYGTGANEVARQVLQRVSLSRLRLPIQNQHDARRRHGFGEIVHQKPLSIRRDGVLLPVDRLYRTADACGEQRHRRAEVDRDAVLPESYRDGHEPPVVRDIEQLLAVRAPTHLGAASGGDL